MADTFEAFLDSRLRYEFAQGPAQVRNLEDAYRGGLNCVALAQLTLKEHFGAELPPELHCYEMFSDATRFTQVTGMGTLQTGDLFWFGRADTRLLPSDFRPKYRGDHLENFEEFPVNHVAVFIGHRNDTGEPLLLHATHLTQTNVIWPLHRFVQFPRYQQLFGVSRLIAATGPPSEATAA